MTRLAVLSTAPPSLFMSLSFLLLPCVVFLLMLSSITQSLTASLAHTTFTMLSFWLTVLIWIWYDTWRGYKPTKRRQASGYIVCQ